MTHTGEENATLHGGDVGAMEMWRRSKIGFMCATDFNHELGHASDGVRVFPSEKALRHHLSCADECGVVEVEITLVPRSVPHPGIEALEG